MLRRARRISHTSLQRARVHSRPRSSSLPSAPLHRSTSTLSISPFRPTQTLLYRCHPHQNVTAANPRSTTSSGRTRNPLHASSASSSPSQSSRLCQLWVEHGSYSAAILTMSAKLSTPAPSPMAYSWEAYWRWRVCSSCTTRLGTCSRHCQFRSLWRWYPM